MDLIEDKGITGCRIGHSRLTDIPRFHDVFDVSRPVEVDIGCGKGRFLVAKANANPDVQYLGIERQLARIRKVESKVRRLALDNVRIIRLEASYCVEYFIQEDSVRRFYMLFPDPWPKRRHHRRRLFDAEFRELIRTRLVVGGEIQVATDHLDYFAEISELLKSDKRFEEVEAFQRSADEETEFERIFKSKGFTIGACGFRRLE